MSSIVHMQTGWWVQLCTCILHARLALRAVGFLYVLEIIIIKIIIKGQKDQHTKRVQGSHFAPQILTCKKKATQKGEYKMGSKRVPTSALQTQTCQKTYSGSNIVHPWWDRTSETSIWNNPCDDPLVHSHWSDELWRRWWWQNTGNSKQDPGCTIFWKKKNSFFFLGSNYLFVSIIINAHWARFTFENKAWTYSEQTLKSTVAECFYSIFSIALWYLWCKVQQTSPSSMTYRLIRAMGAQKSVF